MKINKNVYTQELDKAYTILKQQYIIIKCLLELVDSNNNYDDDLTNIKQTIQRVEQLIQSIEGDLNAVEYDIDLINNYINTINEYIAQNGNTTEIGGNLEVDGNGQVNGNLNINGNLTIDGEPLSVGSINVVREDTLGGFLNTVFSYQSKEDIPNQLQTQANVQNLKQISRDTTAIIARYDSLDYVLQIDALVGDSSTIGFIHGYIYNPNIKDIILVTINTTTGVATFTFNTDSGGSSENVIQDDAIIMDILMNVGGGQTFSRPLTEDEITLFSSNTFNKIKSKLFMEGQEVEISLYNSIEQVGLGGSFFAYLFEFLIYVSIDLTSNDIIYDFIDYSNKKYSCEISGISSYNSTNKKYNITSIGGNDFDLLFDGNYGTIRISLGTTEYKYVIDCYNSTEKYFYINSLGPLSNTPLKIYKDRIEIENDILSNNFNAIFIDTYKFSLVAL